MQSNPRNDRFPGKCNFCGKLGHKWINCGMRLNDSSSTSNSSNSPNSSIQSNSNRNNSNANYNNSHMDSSRSNANWFGQQQQQQGRRQANQNNSRQVNRSSVNSTIGSPMANSSTFSGDESISGGPRCSQYYE
jgi:hypothetical protein